MLDCDKIECFLAKVREAGCGPETEKFVMAIHHALNYVKLCRMKATSRWDPSQLDGSPCNNADIQKHASFWSCCKCDSMKVTQCQGGRQLQSHQRSQAQDVQTRTSKACGGGAEHSSARRLRVDTETTNGSYRELRRALCCPRTCQPGQT